MSQIALEISLNIIKIYRRLNKWKHILGPIMKEFNKLKKLHSFKLICIFSVIPVRMPVGSYMNIINCSWFENAKVISKPRHAWEHTR